MTRPCVLDNRALGLDLPGTHDRTTVPYHRESIPSAQIFWAQDWVRTPAVESKPAPDVQRRTQDILRWTGFSHRELAGILNTSHPTISSLVSGESLQLTRRPELRSAIAGLHALCERIWALSERDSSRVANYLRSPVDDSTVASLAVHGRLAVAYLAALKFHTESQPPSPHEFTQPPGTATAALHE